MQKFLSLFTAGFIFLVSLPFAALAGYAIGFLVGADIHNKGDMGTGIQAWFTLFFGLPIAILATVGGMALIREILKDLYGKAEIKRYSKYASAILILIALITLIYVASNGNFYDY